MRSSERFKASTASKGLNNQTGESHFKIFRGALHMYKIKSFSEHLGGVGGSEL